MNWKLTVSGLIVCGYCAIGWGQSTYTDFPNDRLIEGHPDTIDHWITGNWKFQQVTDLRGKVLQKNQLSEQDFKRIMQPAGRNYSFHTNGFYSFTRELAQNSNEPERPFNGTWKYSHQRGEIELTPLTAHVKNPEQIETNEHAWLTEEGILFPFRHYTFKIASINQNEMTLIVNYIHSEDFIESFLFHYAKLTD
jgi:hypothetical protein